MYISQSIHSSFHLLQFWLYPFCSILKAVIGLFPPPTVLMKSQHGCAIVGRCLLCQESPLNSFSLLVCSFKYCKYRNGLYAIMTGCHYDRMSLWTVFSIMDGMPLWMVCHYGRYAIMVGTLSEQFT
jgi:hypothetical protein